MADGAPDLPASAGRICWTGRVEPADLDENGHMNVRAYDRVLEEAGTRFFYDMGWTPDYPAQEAKGFFRVEQHLRYQAELMQGAPLAVGVWVVATDLKRFHLFFQLWNTQTATRAATLEMMMLHMDLTTRRPVPMADDPRARGWLGLAAAHGSQPPPPGLGRRVSAARQD